MTSPVTTIAYDAAGNRVTVTDPLSRVTTYAYDDVNRLIQTTQPDPDGGGSLGTPITTLSYDNIGRMVSLEDPVGNITSWTFDAAGQVQTEQDPLGKLTTYAYSDAGEVTRITDRRGLHRDFVYDDDGRRTQEKWVNASETTVRIFTYTYDDASQLSEVDETDSRYTFSYDDMGRVTGISSLKANMPQVTLTNTYDGVGRRTSVSDDLATSGTISFSYDAANRMSQAQMTVGGSAGPQADFGYDNANRMTSISRQVDTGTQNKVTTTLTYDDANRLTNITHTYIPTSGPSSTLATYTYSLNAASEITVASHADGTFTYLYDNTGQLTDVDGPNAGSGVCESNACDETFEYDENGNRTSSSGYGLSQTYTVSTGNRITDDGIYTYAYDDNGNRSEKTRQWDGQKWEYTWDYRNRLTSVVEKNSSDTVVQQTDYTYDAFNRRIIIEHDPDGPGEQSSTKIKTVYDAQNFTANPYADFDGSDSLQTRYLYGPAVDWILGRLDYTGNVDWYLANNLGSVHDLVDVGGSLQDHVSYSAFGVVVTESNSSAGDRFKFTGRENDNNSDVQFNRGRYYEAGLGRWVSQDPTGFAAGDTNLFRYVQNRPTILVDPEGQAAGPSRTPPTPAPGRNIGKLGGVHVYSNGSLADHGPGHVHVVSDKGTVKVGPHGKPIQNQRQLSAAEKKAVDKYLPQIKEQIRKVQRKWRKMNEYNDWLAKQAEKVSKKGISQTARRALPSTLFVALFAAPSIASAAQEHGLQGAIEEGARMSMDTASDAAVESLVGSAIIAGTIVTKTTITINGVAAGLGLSSIATVGGAGLLVWYVAYSAGTLIANTQVGEQTVAQWMGEAMYSGAPWMFDWTV